MKPCGCCCNLKFVGIATSVWWRPIKGGLVYYFWTAQMHKHLTVEKLRHVIAKMIWPLFSHGQTPLIVCIFLKAVLFCFFVPLLSRLDLQLDPHQVQLCFLSAAPILPFTCILFLVVCSMGMSYHKKSLPECNGLWCHHLISKSRLSERVVLLEISSQLHLQLSWCKRCLQLICMNVLPFEAVGILVLIGRCLTSTQLEVMNSWNSRRTWCWLMPSWSTAPSMAKKKKKSRNETV